MQNPARALQLLCKSVAVFAMIPYRTNKMEHYQTAAFNDSLRQFNVLSEMLAKDSYELNQRRDEVLLLDVAIKDLQEKWLKSDKLSDGSELAVKDFMKSLEHLRRALYGNWSEKMFPMFDKTNAIGEPMRFADFKEFYINVTCDGCPTTKRGLTHIYEDIHVPDLVEIIGGNFVWGQYKFTCPVDEKHKVYPSMHSGKGRIGQPLSLVLGVPLNEYLARQKGSKS